MPINIDINCKTESNHDTPLTLACQGGHTELVQLLVQRGAELEHRDKKGFTPLILAATGKGYFLPNGKKNFAKKLPIIF